MVKQQLQLPQARLSGPGPIEARLAQGGAGDGERVERIRIAAHAPAPTLGRAVSRGGTRTSRSPAPSSSASKPRLTWRQSSSAHSRLPASERAQPSSAASGGPLQRASSRPSSSTATAVSSCLCTSTRSRSLTSPPSVEGRPASEQASIEAAARAPIGSRSAVSGRRRRHNTGKSALGRHAGIGSAAAARVCAAQRTPPPAEDDIECEKSLERARTADERD